jgi:hypothetical protein
MPAKIKTGESIRTEKFTIFIKIDRPNALPLHNNCQNKTMKNFTISFYFYHLCHSLTDAPEKLSADADKLWKGLAKFGEENSLFPELKLNSNSDESGWLTPNSSPINFEKIDTTEDWKIEGNLLPFRLHDTYFADLTLSPQPSDFYLQSSEIQQFPINALLPDKINPSLGQTIWIYGEVDKGDRYCQEIADEYVRAITKDSNYAEPTLVNVGKLFGSLLYEYEAAHKDEPKNIAKKCHFLVLINNSEANTVELAGKAYEWLRDLLCCRHKILFVYQQSRENYLQGRKLYSELEKEIGHFSEEVETADGRLDYLKDLLKNLPQNYLNYARCLRDLKAHQTTIETNTSNYQICQEKIANLGEVPPSWQEFLTRCELWQRQIKTDLNYLSPGQDLFQQVVNTARSIAEIDQAESDRSLEKTIQLLGAGLGSGAIAASAIAGHVQTPIKLKPDYPIHPAITTLFWSAIFGLIGWGIASFCTGGWSGLKKNNNRK